MAGPLLSDDLWSRMESLLPQAKPRRFDHPGRKPLTARQVLTGILFVLKTGVRWNDLPCEMGCGSGSRCRRWLKAWTEAGVWSKLHEVLLAELNEAGKIDWSRAAVDSPYVRARGGGEDTGPSPVDRRKVGSKHHVVVDANGIPLAATLSSANTPDISELEKVVDAIAPVRSKRGHPRRRPKRLLGDRGYDSDPHRAKIRRRGILARFGRRRTPHGSGLGKERWVVERFFSWYHRFGRLRIRTDYRSKIHRALMSLGCSLICLRFL